MSVLPAPIRRVLEAGAFCHVAALTPIGPHVTPMVFATAAGRVWVTTSRRSVKARAWASDPRVAGLVRAGDQAVAFAGSVTTHDVLDPSSWGRSLVAAPALSLAGARFTRKNARFFAGYAVDAHQVPFAWTPPGRVFVEIAIERSAVLGGERAPHTWGDGESDGAPPSRERFRLVRAGEPALGPLPHDVREALGTGGVAALAIEGEAGPVVLPVRWLADGAGLYAVADEATFELPTPGSSRPRVALGMDRPSSWRARRMLGAMARGTAEVFVVEGLSSGGASARRIASAAGVRDRPVIVRIRPERFVWWRGWDSGTVAAA